MSRVKRQKDTTLEDEPLPPPGQKVSNMLLGKIREQLPIAQKE